MNKIKIEEMTYECQTGMYFTDKKILSNGFIMFSSIVDSQSWNFYTGFKAKTIQEFTKGVNEAIDFFKQINREFCLLISPCTKISKTVLKYIEKNYENVENNAILFTKNFIVQKQVPQTYSFRKINNKTEKNLFIKTFKTSKSQTLNADTYGPLPKSFFDALSNSFESKHNWKFYNYISEFEGQPIGMVSACVNDKFCGLYGGGTYIAHRGNGVFSNLLKFIQNDLKKENVKYFFGLTEQGSKNELYYNYINFNTLYYDKLYKQKNKQ